MSVATPLKRRRSVSPDVTRPLLPYLYYPAPAPDPVTRATFLGRVFDMLTPAYVSDHNPGSLSWRSNGTSMIIRDPTLFAETLLPSAFPGQKDAKVFLRSLQDYDFRHKTQKGGHIFIKHPALNITSTREEFTAIPRKTLARRVTHETFLGRVYDMMVAHPELTTNIIRWSSDGTQIVVDNAKAFERTVLPVCLPTQRRVQTFARSLHFYGFNQRTEYPSGRLMLTHPTLTQASSREDFLAVPHVLYNTTAIECLTIISPFERSPLRHGLSQHSNAAAASTEPKQAPSKVFIGRVHDMLSSPDRTVKRAVGWSKDGTEIVIFDPDKMLKCLPTFFPRQSKVRSFLSSLRMYGFVRRDNGGGKRMIFVHPTLNSGSTRAEFHATPRKQRSKQPQPSSVGAEELEGQELESEQEVELDLSTLLSFDEKGKGRLIEPDANDAAESGSQSDVAGEPDFEFELEPREERVRFECPHDGCGISYKLEEALQVHRERMGH
ncbi:C2H2-type domain-containing protein [Mycena indigotica]|uniref:C2H2-type domain-containing protein n=1 Tax=Mycena indigotica TaxID=2126181 RepID=A0A8H6SDI9_9AGAR|nr:C2H2-type domain-containing protein [Mycena indigotica]KAF7297478.1 C2H2-type domain-containing protein [Mycena indigotica]